MTAQQRRAGVGSKTHDPLQTATLQYWETWVTAQITSTSEGVGGLMELCTAYRGEMVEVTYPSPDRVFMTVQFPLGEILFNFYDKLKSLSRGYASFDYRENEENRRVKLSRVEIQVNSETVDALCFICRTDDAYDKGRRVIRELKKTIKRQNFQVEVRALIKKKPIARETIKAYRKDVLTKAGKTVGGGDESRKKKLLERQKEGKKRMKIVGNVELSEESFLAVVSMDT